MPNKDNNSFSKDSNNNIKSLPNNTEINNININLKDQVVLRGRIVANHCQHHNTEKTIHSQKFKKNGMSNRMMMKMMEITIKTIIIIKKLNRLGILLETPSNLMRILMSLHPLPAALIRETQYSTH